MVCFFYRTAQPRNALITPVFRIRVFPFNWHKIKIPGAREKKTAKEEVWKTLR
jgi:hypothetical protein